MEERMEERKERRKGSRYSTNAKDNNKLNGQGRGQVLTGLSSGKCKGNVHEIKYTHNIYDLKPDCSFVFVQLFKEAVL